jgi:predicted nucleic acid-binding protein
MNFIDSNIFLRYFIKDDSETENLRIENFFASIVDGQINCFTNTMVINEILWVLEKY